MGGLLSVPKTLESLYSRRTAACILIPFKKGEDVLEDGAVSTGVTVGPRFLQYFPETITDTKAINYAPKDVPGGNLPLYQWISGGERTISFTAIFSSDADLSVVNPLRHQSEGLRNRNVDVKSALLWLRSFLMPEYTDGQGTIPPRKLLLYIPNSGIGLYGGYTSNPDGIVCLMTDCGITIDAMWPDGTPRMATVSLAFAQTPQRASGVFFPGYQEEIGSRVYSQPLTRKEGNGFYGYRLAPSVGETAGVLNANLAEG